MWLRTRTTRQLSTMVKQGLMMMQMATPPPFQALISTLRSNFKTITGLSVFTGSGLKCTLTLNNFADFDILPSFDQGDEPA